MERRTHRPRTHFNPHKIVDNPLEKPYSSCMNKNMECNFCKEEDVVYVRSCFPYTTEHWQCPKCDSTYNWWEYPKKEQIENQPK